jgi:hypothetical protein
MYMCAVNTDAYTTNGKREKTHTPTIKTQTHYHMGNSLSQNSGRQKNKFEQIQQIQTKKHIERIRSEKKYNNNLYLKSVKCVKRKKKFIYPIKMICFSSNNYDKPEKNQF